jgi:hypothetical protein
MRILERFSQGCRSGSAFKGQNGAVECRGGGSQWRPGRSKWNPGGSIPVVADSHHFDEEEDPDPDPP